MQAICFSPLAGFLGSQLVICVRLGPNENNAAAVTHSNDAGWSLGSAGVDLHGVDVRWGKHRQLFVLQSRAGPSLIDALYVRRREHSNRQSELPRRGSDCGVA